ncbi:uncharacterized protein LOC8029684 isoform X2 [Ixodes scapularis]|uniref:Uncharacterized protein n=1 Tax=Ixodes scapularis TaxID=6945 RepID=B7PJ25_IXOSC|nr:uncharacterized protein LOC8029684 isoform X2 [Ixodes scapularis]EEC06597.1 hypothetical protein IscW_ISCW004203 [Ixodes scapularis]|eukprot:XP_002406786.1 hypothetical protein IscW_ISCW004203 [Ixodes scapularis]
MLSFINSREDHASFQAVSIPGPVELETVAKIWTVLPDHLFYTLKDDESLFACRIYSSAPCKKTAVLSASQFTSLVTAKCNSVLVIFTDGSVRAFKFVPEEGWTECASFRLFNDPSSRLTYACSCINQKLFWIQRSNESPLETCCSLWKCSLSLELSEDSGSRCVAQRLPPFRLHVLRLAAVVLPSLPRPSAIYLAFGESDCLKVCSLAAETALLSGTFQPPLDAAAFYKKRIWIWRSQPQCQVVRGCPSPLANSLQLLLQDGSVVVLDSAGNFQRRITLCIGALGARAVCSLGVALCTFSDSVLSLYDLENGELLQELPLKGSFRGLLPALWGFWTDTGLFRLAGGSRWSPGPPSELQSEALLYAARHAGAHALLGPPDNTQVGTRLSRILRPLVECYWKLQLTRSALVS